HQDPVGPPTRPQDRPGRPGPPTGRGDLAHAHNQQALRPGRRRVASGPAEGPPVRCATGAKPLPSDLVLLRGGNREMSAAPAHPARPPPGTPVTIPVHRRPHGAAGSSRVQVVVLAAARLRALHLDPLVTGSRAATRRPTSPS